MYRYLKSWVIDSSDMKKKKKEKKFQKKKNKTPSFSHVAIENASKKPIEKSQKQKAQMKSYLEATMLNEI